MNLVAIAAIGIDRQESVGPFDNRLTIDGQSLVGCSVEVGPRKGNLRHADTAVPCCRIVIRIGVGVIRHDVSGRIDSCCRVVESACLTSRDRIVDGIRCRILTLDRDRDRRGILLLEAVSLDDRCLVDITDILSRERTIPDRSIINIAGKVTRGVVRRHAIGSDIDIGSCGRIDRDAAVDRLGFQLAIDIELDAVEIAAAIIDDDNVMPVAIGHIGGALDTTAIDLDTHPAVGVGDPPDPLLIHDIGSPGHDACGTRNTGIDPGRHRSDIRAANTLVSIEGHKVTRTIQGQHGASHR